MAENQKQSNRERLMGRYAEKYPDRQYADEESLYGQAMEDYEASDKELQDYRDRESKLTDLFKRDTRAARFLTQMANGEDPLLSIIEQMGSDGISDVLNDPAKKEIYAEANKRFVERLAKEEGLQAEYDKNFAESMKRIGDMQEREGIDDATLDKAMDLVFGVLNDALVGKFTEETVRMALKAVNYEGDMAAARTEGNVAGRNERIQEKLRKPDGGDGMPVMGGSNNTPAKKRNRSMFDLLGQQA